ncbi:MAG: L-serine ammonia-lyase [Paraglaciecola sp.]|uniref:L-serine ammonia-lyase n=1 Tax=Paraglaciecola sp. TaxID=1920173 RepID=UPI0032981019
MISVFDMFSVGIGPSSSHTVGPMKAAAEFVKTLDEKKCLVDVSAVKVELFGSLGQTGIGHGTGKAVLLGLLGEHPATIDIDSIEGWLKEIELTNKIKLNHFHEVNVPLKEALVYHRRKCLPKHANALTIFAYNKQQEVLDEATYYSIGGGFIVHDDEFDSVKNQASLIKNNVLYPFKSAARLLELCAEHGLSISSLMAKNEACHEKESVINEKLFDIWLVMKACVKRGIKTEGILPGGLKVERRAPSLHRQLLSEKNSDPMQSMDWVNLFALAVNEENAAGGRVVTAPTNGAAGIIPAVMHYFDMFVRPIDVGTASRFLLTAGAIGILYKENASISGAEVGCQGEVGVACSMAAGALTELMGGSIKEVENAAEIGMEHNLGLTCDPVGGLVQVPCIERNAMGAVKAINASRLALRGNGNNKVSLDKVIKTMLETGNDMKSKYKETARGGLAVNITEC